MQRKSSLSFRYVFWFVLLQGLLATSVFADTADRAVANAYQRWCSAIATADGRANDVVKFYAPNAILLPTLAPEILFNRKNGGKHAYFEALTSKKNIRCIPEKLITRVYGNMAINSGFYQFSYTDERGQTKNIPARFTFVYEKMGDRWMIVNHHSSVVPAASH